MLHAGRTIMALSGGPRQAPIVASNSLDSHGNHVVSPSIIRLHNQGIYLREVVPHRD